MALIGALCAPLGFLSCIRYGDDGLTIRTFFGRVHRLRWEDVTTMQEGRAGVSTTRPRRSPPRQDGFIIADGRKFYVNYAMSGAGAFIACAKQKCRQRGVNPAPPRRKDVFHGHVRNAGTVLFGWWFAAIFWALCAGVMLYFGIRNPEDRDALLLAGISAAALIWQVFHCLRGVKVGRAPEKYGKKVFESYFGKGSWEGH